MKITKIIEGDCLDVLGRISDKSINLIYVDPPFNTGITRVGPSDPGLSYSDKRYKRCDYLSFTERWVMESIRVLTDDGSLFIHLDYRTVHHVYCLVDKLFSSALQMMNEIIWAYDYGGRSKKYWPRKHDTILWYVRDPDNYVYNYAAIDRIPYLAPGLCGPDKEAIGKVPTDVWWHTIVCGHEKTGYPTQKPVELLRRIVAVHSRPGDVVLDFFAGSGTTGEAAGRLGRGYIMVDNNPQAITIMERRLAYYR